MGPEESAMTQNRPCDHPYVVHGADTFRDKSLMRGVYYRLYFACGVCGEREGFENFSVLSAEAYNRERGAVRMGHAT
jgi:hypothetical protein